MWLHAQDIPSWMGNTTVVEPLLESKLPQTLVDVWNKPFLLHSHAAFE